MRTLAQLNDCSFIIHLEYCVAAVADDSVDWWRKKKHRRKFYELHACKCGNKIYTKIIIVNLLSNHRPRKNFNGTSPALSGENSCNSFIIHLPSARWHMLARQERKKKQISFILKCKSNADYGRIKPTTNDRDEMHIKLTPWQSSIVFLFFVFVFR